MFSNSICPKEREKGLNLQRELEKPKRRIAALKPDSANTTTGRTTQYLQNPTTATN
jgi:hypothetical protein